MITELQRESDYAMIRELFNRFMPIDNEVYKVIVDHVSYTEVEKGTAWIAQGERSSHLGILVDGLIAGVEDVDGDEYATVFFPSPNFVTEYVGFVQQMPAQHSLFALEHSRVYSWSYESLQQMYAVSKDGERLGRLIAEWVIATVMKEVRSFRFDSATERYEKLVARNPSLVQRVPQYMIASYLGVTPESLSRIRAKLSKR